MLIDRYGNPLKIYSRQHQTIGSSAVMKRRLTQDDEYFTAGFGAIHAPTDEADWRLELLDEQRLAQMGASSIIDTLTNASPDLDRALHDMMTHINTGFTLLTQENDSVAQAILDASLVTMAQAKSPIKVKIDKLVSSGFLKGAFFVETVFEADEFIDVRIIDPFTARYRDEEDTRRGQYKQLGQQQDGRFVPLNEETVQYIPLNSREGQFFGRSLVSSAIFPILFTLGLMKSTRQVIETQAYPFRLATIDRQALVDAQIEPDEVKTIIEETEERLKKEFLNAQKGTGFIFGREVQIEVIGAANRMNFDVVEMLTGILDRQIVRALKQFPLIFGVNDGNALSTNAEQQMEAFTIFIESFQEKIEEVFTAVFTQILRQAGSAATPIFKLRRMNTLVERFRAERMKLKMEGIGTMLEYGLINRQEGRLLVRSADAFNTLAELLDPELPSDAIPMMNNPNNPSDSNEDADRSGNMDQPEAE